MSVTSSLCRNHNYSLSNDQRVWWGGGRASDQSSMAKCTKPRQNPFVNPILQVWCKKSHLDIMLGVKMRKTKEEPSLYPLQRAHSSDFLYCQWRKKYNDSALEGIERALLQLKGKLLRHRGSLWMHPLTVQPLQKIIRSFGMEKALSKEKNEDLSNFHVRHDIQVQFFASDWWKGVWKGILTWFSNDILLCRPLPPHRQDLPPRVVDVIDCQFGDCLTFAGA